MSSTLFDLSGKIDRQTVDALAAVKKIADSLEIPFFVIGASARDFVLKHGYGIEPPRKTLDIDLGVEVPSWDQFNKLKEALEATGKFIRDERLPQRLHSGSVIIDIVPFGAITDEKRTIAWPPERETVMSVAGFKEAHEHSMLVRLSAAPDLDIRLPTLPGLALMKIISWNEKYPERRKDAADLLLIMHSYEEAGNFDRLFGSEQDLLHEEKFDARVAGIRLLGRDMARMAQPGTWSAVRSILERETGERATYRLIGDMVRESCGHEGRFDEILSQVEKLKQGFDEAAP